jgi:hypothetical protein
MLLAGCTSTQPPAALSSAPPGGTPSPRATPGAASSVTPRNTQPSSVQVVRAESLPLPHRWHARVFGGSADRDAPVAGDRNSLYVTHDNRLLRLDPVTGSVVAVRATMPDMVVAGLAADRIWVVVHPGSPGVLTLLGLDATDLKTVATVELTHHWNEDSGEVALSVNPSDRRVYVGVGRTISVINAETGSIADRYSVSEQIFAIGATPDDARLYVTMRRGTGMTATLLAVYPSSGATINDALLTTGSGAFGVTASDGGAWLETGTGMTDAVNFERAGDLTRQGRAYTFAGGGWPASRTIAEDTMWIGGTTRIVCADPNTGRIRAAARVPTPHADAANISDFTLAGGRLFARYLTAYQSTQTLITLRPPHACTP